jgi:hypothetical protein
MDEHRVCKFLQRTNASFSNAILMMYIDSRKREGLPFCLTGHDPFLVGTEYAVISMVCLDCDIALFCVLLESCFAFECFIGCGSFLDPNKAESRGLINV